MSFENEMDNVMDKIRDAKKEKLDLKAVLNKKNFDSFELDLLMNEEM